MRKLFSIALFFAFAFTAFAQRGDQDCPITGMEYCPDPHGNGPGFWTLCAWGCPQLNCPGDCGCPGNMQPNCFQVKPKLPVIVAPNSSVVSPEMMKRIEILRHTAPVITPTVVYARYEQDPRDPKDAEPEGCGGDDPGDCPGYYKLNCPGDCGCPGAVPPLCTNRGNALHPKKSFFRRLVAIVR